MAQGSHFWSMFLRNGPLMFYKKIRALIERTEIEEKSATDMIEARVSCSLFDFGSLLKISCCTYHILCILYQERIINAKSSLVLKETKQHELVFLCLDEQCETVCMHSMWLRSILSLVLCHLGLVPHYLKCTEFSNYVSNNSFVLSGAYFEEFGWNGVNCLRSSPRNCRWS